jgi:hypothetical protein
MTDLELADYTGIRSDQRREQTATTRRGRRCIFGASWCADEHPRVVGRQIVIRRDEMLRGIPDGGSGGGPGTGLESDKKICNETSVVSTGIGRTRDEPESLVYPLR